MSIVNKECPCGSGEKYKKCCQPFHKGAIAQKAVTVMRARYSAFAVSDIAYIIATTHPDHPDAEKERREEISLFSRSTLFKKLEILKIEEGEPFSYVTFRVQLEQNGKDVGFTEKSTFAKHRGKWLYLKGEIIASS